MALNLECKWDIYNSEFANVENLIICYGDNLSSLIFKILLNLFSIPYRKSSKDNDALK